MIGSARYWREIPQRYRLEASRCCKCGKTAYPPRPDGRTLFPFRRLFFVATR